VGTTHSILLARHRTFFGGPLCDAFATVKLLGLTPDPNSLQTSVVTTIPHHRGHTAFGRYSLGCKQFIIFGGRLSSPVTLFSHGKGAKIAKNAINSNHLNMLAVCS
jgi:hypothetical protein